jgi:two-component system chemotaxis response regulator CheB
MSDTPAPLRALVVDDSAYNRQTITAMLEALPDVQVVGRAMNGKEALKLAFELDPDVITLDLEMPEMDGFAFLRLLMHKRPTPVIVVSGYSARENVFRALELGAMDFVAKPRRDISPDLKEIEAELGRKVALVRRLQVVRLRDRARSLAAAVDRHAGDPAIEAKRDAGPPPRRREGAPPRAVLAIASSTGGPPAVQQLLAGLPADLPLAVVVAQHMPARFTTAFAQRLDKVLPFEVFEAIDGHPLRAGDVVIAPGASNVELERPAAGWPPVVRVVAPAVPKGGGPVLTPSGDHLFRSLAVFGDRACVAVLTGMGSDGRDGAREAHARGAHVLAEDPASAVMPGMPHSAIEAGVVDEVLGLDELSVAVRRFVQSRPA